MDKYEIETKKLSKSFMKEKSLIQFIKNPIKETEIKALQNIDLKVKFGQLYGLLGPNGAGKTTLVKILGTLLLPDSGEALIRGHNVVNESSKVKLITGLSYGEERSFYWRLTGRQNLTFFSALYDNVPKKNLNDYIDFLLDIVDLKEKADFRVDSYSTGMKHRLAIARSLVGDPEILLMDEPTLGVDPIGREMIQDFIRELVDKGGKTVLLVTNDLEEAERICDTVAIMNKGEIKEIVENVRENKVSLLPIYKKIINS
jgi:ABC-2 type transport system ATP-binding protein